MSEKHKECPNCGDKRIITRVNYSNRDKKTNKALDNWWLELLSDGSFITFCPFCGTQLEKEGRPDGKIPVFIIPEHLDFTISALFEHIHSHIPPSLEAEEEYEALVKDLRKQHNEAIKNE